MIVNFKEKFKGNNKLIRVADSATAVPLLILWFWILRGHTEKICQSLIQTNNVFHKMVLEAPIYVGYLLFYWGVLSWLVYYIAKPYYVPPAKDR